jgi:hypothetical protein
MVRPGSHHRVVRFERQNPSTGAWAPINTYGLACLPRQPELLTNSAGVVLATAPWVGPGDYRMSWLRPGDNTWIPGVQVTVDQPTPIGGPSTTQTLSP